jgi:hypothetical protein
MHYVVDRIESGIAVCNSLTTGEDMEIKASELPAKTKEGDIIAETDGKYIFDKELTEKRRADLKARMDRLFDK